MSRSFRSMRGEQLNKALSSTFRIASFEFSDTEELFGFCVSRFYFQSPLEKLDGEFEIRLRKKRVSFFFINMLA